MGKKKLNYEALFDLARHDLELYLQVIHDLELLVEPLGFVPNREDPSEVYFFIRDLLEGNV